MNIKTELIALAVRVAADHTNLIQKPDNFTETINAFFGYESFDKRLAKDIETDVDRVVAAAKSLNTRRKFRSITKSI
jgi:ABC-type enterochelin transport system substrate-binding protein